MCQLGCEAPILLKILCICATNILYYIYDKSALENEHVDRSFTVCVTVVEQNKA